MAQVDMEKAHVENTKTSTSSICLMHIVVHTLVFVQGPRAVNIGVVTEGTTPLIIIQVAGVKKKNCICPGSANTSTFMLK